MISRFTIVTLLLSCLVFQLQQSTVSAQSSFEGVDQIPSSAVAAVYIRPAAILADPSMELVPHELLTAWGMQTFGLDLCKVKNATLLLDEFVDADPRHNPFRFALTLRFDEDQTLSEDFLADGKKLDFRGKPLYIFSRRDDQPVLYRPDAKTVVFGMQSFIEKMMDSKGASGPLADLVGSAAAEIDHVNAFVTMERIRPFIDQTVPAKRDLPWQFQQFRDLPDQIESLNLRMNFTSDPINQLQITAVDEESGKKVMKSVEQGLSMGRAMLMSELGSNMWNQPAMLEAIEAYDSRVGDRIEKMLLPTLSGRTLTFDAKSNEQVSNAAVVGTLMGMMIPATFQARSAARRVGSMNQLRQIALACLNYESAHMRFPGNITDKDGKPLLSWRVAILPFIEENDLYEQFHLDEPWDSEHNIKLLDQLPEIYANLQVDSDTKTVFQGFEGAGTIFEPGAKIGFAQITDGSSNTILCVEANADSAVEWSKPADLPFAPGEPVTQVGKLRKGGFSAALCDGSVHFVSEDLDKDSLSHMIQRADGNIVHIP